MVDETWWWPRVVKMFSQHVPLIISKITTWNSHSDVCSRPRFAIQNFMQWHFFQPKHLCLPCYQCHHYCFQIPTINTLCCYMYMYNWKSCKCFHPYNYDDLIVVGLACEFFLHFSFKLMNVVTTTNANG